MLLCLNKDQRCLLISNDEFVIFTKKTPLLPWQQNSDNMTNSLILEQDKSSDIEQQPPFGDRKISNIQPQKRTHKFSFL